jgi:hypothetical protein
MTEAEVDGKGDGIAIPRTCHDHDIIAPDG